MKKIITFTLLLLVLFLIVSCNNEGVNGEQGKINGKYKLTVVDEYDMLVEELNGYYEEGDTIVVKTKLACDASVLVELNGAKAQNRATVKDENDRYSHTEWKFVMPAKASVLEVTISSGMDAEYYGVILKDPNGLVVNDLEGMYTPGETVKIKTHTSTFENAYIGFEANKLYVKYDGEIKNEKGELLYYEWSFVMPHEDVTVSVVLSNIEYYLNVQDEDLLLQNSIVGYYKIGDEIEIHLNRTDVDIILNGLMLDLSLEEVLDENGERLYYKQIIEMPNRPSTLKLELDMQEPTLNHLVFIDNTPYSMFETDYSGEYAAGEIVTFSSAYGILDAEILLKANGVKIEESAFQEWQLVMPAEDVTVCAYLINTSWGENWHYLNIEDKEGALTKISDGYYKQGVNVKLYTDCLINLNVKDGIIDSWCLDELENGQSRYVYSFTMPSSAVTIDVSIDEYEPILRNLKFIADESVEGFFVDTFSGEYLAGEVITVTTDPEYLFNIKDAEILIKVNGKRVEEAEHHKWQFTMPNEDVTVNACLINTSWGENWHYLNIEDKNGLLYRIYDGYYKAGDTVTIKTKWFEHWFYLDITVEGCDELVYEIAKTKQENGCEHTFSFVMPNCDFTLKIGTKLIK